jgi:CubicO group peptidase (beta-lactamase class C family)
MKTKLLLFTAILGWVAGMAQPNRPAQIQRLKDLFSKAEKNGFSGSVIVARDTDILLKHGYGWQDHENQIPEAPETVFPIGNITKQFTAAAILKLEIQGKLSVQDPLSRFFPEAPADKANITIHQLLTHTSGFPDVIGVETEQIEAKAFLRRAFATKLWSISGESHRYSNVGYSILGIIIEQVSGYGYDQYLYRNLWKPAGMEHTGYHRPGFKKNQVAVGYKNDVRQSTELEQPWLPDGPGWHLRANRGLLSTVGDLYRWFRALRGDSILDQASKAKFFTPYVKECPDCPGKYGYGWTIETNSDGQTLILLDSGSGAGNAFLGFMPSSGLFTAISSNSNDKSAGQFAGKIARILTGEDPGMSEEAVQKWSGAWRLPGGQQVNIRFDELDRLVVDWEDPEALTTLSGDGSENTFKTGQMVSQSTDILDQSRQGKGETMAVAMKITPEEAEEIIKGFWKNNETRFGKVLETRLIGAVLRPARDACLVFYKVKFEKKTQYLTYVWINRKLTDVRETEKMEKEFDQESATRFSASNNGMTLYLNNDGTITLENKFKKETTLKR